VPGGTDHRTWSRPGTTESKALPEDTRRHNRGYVLHELFRRGPQSRAELARATHLSRVTMSDLVAGLLDEHLVEEVGRPEDQGVGKPATLVGIVPDARHIVCLDLSDEAHFHGALVNLGGKVLERRTCARNGRTGDAAVELVADLAHELLSETRQPILGIGIGSPGVVDSDGVVVEAARLQWHGVPLGAILAKRLPAPVYVTNDANASTLAEFTFGGVEGRSMLLVKIGQGVGAGLLIDGELFVGDHFAAGEIGHVVIDERGEPCTCGRRGCLETAVAAHHLRRKLHAKSPSEHANVSRAAGRKLGVALAIIVSALNLHEVVLSVPTDLAGEPFRVAALDTIRRRTMPAVGDHVDLRYSALGDDDVLLGSAVLVLEQELGVR
jgi:predicted NBD/HSP70 family sugar kinase